MAKLADASDLGSDGKPYGFESLRLHHRRRKANSATAPRISGELSAFTPYVSSLRRKNARRSLAPRFPLRRKTVARSLVFAPRERLPPPFNTSEGGALPRSDSPPVADALIPQPKSMILPGNPLCRPACRVQIRCRQFAVPSSLCSSLRVPSTAPLRNNTNQNAK